MYVVDVIRPATLQSGNILSMSIMHEFGTLCGVTKFKYALSIKYLYSTVVIFYNYVFRYINKRIVFIL